MRRKKGGENELKEEEEERKNQRRKSRLHIVIRDDVQQLVFIGVVVTNLCTALEVLQFTSVFSFISSDHFRFSLPGCLLPITFVLYILLNVYSCCLTSRQAVRNFFTSVSPLRSFCLFSLQYSSFFLNLSLITAQVLGGSGESGGWNRK